MAIQGNPQDIYSRYLFLIDTELEQIRRYMQGMEKSIKDEQIRTQDWVKEQMAEYEGLPLPSDIDEISMQLETFTPNLFYRSALTTLYSFFESVLRGVAKTEKENRLCIPLGKIFWRIEISFSKLSPLMKTY